MPELYGKLREFKSAGPISVTHLLTEAAYLTVGDNQAITFECVSEERKAELLPNDTFIGKLGQLVGTRIFQPGQRTSCSIAAHHKADVGHLNFVHAVLGPFEINRDEVVMLFDELQLCIELDLASVLLEAIDHDSFGAVLTD